MIGASSVKQLDENVAVLDNLALSAEEIAEIDQYAEDGGVDLWKKSRNAA